MKEIIVKSQQELDNIDVNDNVAIKIEFGGVLNPAVVCKHYKYNVEARENSNVVAWGNSNVEAWENSNVVARENSNVEARENSNVEAWENSNVVARENSNVEARENSNVVAWGNSNVVACGNSNVVACGNSNVVAWGKSNVEARENSNVEARGKSNVVARGNVQVVKCSDYVKIKTAGNARIVYNPRNVEDYMNFYDIKHTKTTALLYKAVHKEGDKYISDYDKDFEYVIGKKVNSRLFDNCVDNECGQGIHVSHLIRAMDFGNRWNDLAIIELKVKIKDILLPNCSNGKVRVPKAEVIREVPLEECGLYGKILMTKRCKK